MMSNSRGRKSVGRVVGVSFVGPLMFALLSSFGTANGVDHISFRQKDRTQHVSGDVLVEAQDGGVLLQSADGTLWIIQPEEMTDRRRDDEPLVPLDSEQLAARLVAELPAGFKTHSTAHYVVAYNTTDAYAHWCGALYERLFRAFYSFWDNQGVALQEPRMPLVAVIFQDRDSYEAYSRDELGDAAASIDGYYSVRSNRVAMFDLTGVDGRTTGSRVTTAAHVNAILSRPQAERTVATIVHEATHQLAYNSGLQTRYGDNPFWVSEGLAVFFETPDLQSSKGWRNIGGINRVNLVNFRKYLSRRPQDSLATLLTDDSRFRDPQQVRDAYAEAWALTTFLVRTQTKQYGVYLQRLADRDPLETLSKEERLAEFQNAFGSDLARLNREFLLYVQRMR